MLDIIFGKKLEDDDAERAKGGGLPAWVRTVYRALHTGLILLAFALLAWSWGWMPFTHSRIDSIWAMGALGVGALLGSGWEWITKRYERRALAGRGTKAAFLE